MPGVNLFLLIAVIVCCIGFKSSSAMAGAYGLAVTATMLCTSLLSYVVLRQSWHYSLWLALPATLFFVLIDSSLLLGSMQKIGHGGWVPLLLGAGLMVLMWTWWQGRQWMRGRLSKDDLLLQPFAEELSHSDYPRALRTAVYLVPDATYTPSSLLHNLKHNKTLHLQQVFVQVVFENKPWVAHRQIARIYPLAPDFWKIKMHFGFMQIPDIPRALKALHIEGLDLSPERVTYFVSREVVEPQPGSAMAPWRIRLFASLSRNAVRVERYFHLPEHGVIELGSRVHF
jgi:KUP system potassium uptake protein